MEYHSPEVLVSTEWVADHLNDTNTCIVESNEDNLLYRSGHIPGAIEIDWVRDLNDATRRDYLDSSAFQELMSKNGITKDTTVIFYGDKNNWWACYAFWVFQLFGHTNAKIMNGGKLKWEKEERPLTKEKTAREITDYPAVKRDDVTDRIFRNEVLEEYINAKQLVDVRSPEEYSGERLHMPDYPNEGALRGGHIPGAVSLPWAMAINPDDGTFKTRAELEEIYLNKIKFSSDKDTVVYCRIGERSSHTWFVLRYLLGFSNVKNYDGSWTEWGNLVGVPIEK